MCLGCRSGERRRVAGHVTVRAAVVWRAELTIGLTRRRAIVDRNGGAGRRNVGVWGLRVSCLSRAVCPVLLAVVCRLGRGRAL